MNAQNNRSILDLYYTRISRVFQPKSPCFLRCASRQERKDRLPLWEEWAKSVSGRKGAFSSLWAEEEKSHICYSCEERCGCFAFGLHYASMDIILTPEGESVWLEANPNGLV
jgi:hypothetical protein